MSMSGFDRQPNSGGDEFSPSSMQGRVIPADFGEDDLAFVEELNSLFSPAEEELPPYFVQTLLDAEDPRFYPVERGFEHKTRARVFRHLRLRRRLYSAPRSVFSGLLNGISGILARRSLLAATAAFMLIMLFTVAFTAQSFAQGLTILLQSGHGGVYETMRYPKNVHTVQREIKAKAKTNQPEQLTMLAAQQELHFKMYWPQSLPANYSLDSISLYQMANQPWADGPIVELVYDLSRPGVAPKGTGQIVIREFKPTEDVLQLVEDGAAQPIQVGHDGRAKAIYVNGQWIESDKLLPQWFYGQRSELIYQQDGIVFWIAGDQRDGIDQKVLWATAQSLQTMPFNHLMFMKGETTIVTQSDISQVHDPFTNDVLVLNPNDNVDGPLYLNLSTYQSEKTAQKTVVHGT